VPRSYLDLEKLLLREAKKRKKENDLPIMTHEEFSSLVSLIPKNDINTPEELTLGGYPFCLRTNTSNWDI